MQRGLISLVRFRLACKLLFTKFGLLIFFYIHDIKVSQEDNYKRCLLDIRNSGKDSMEAT